MIGTGPVAAFVHTAAGHAKTFQELWVGRGGDSAIHLVDEELLALCMTAADDPATARRVRRTLDSASSLAPLVGVSCVAVADVARRVSTHADVVLIDEAAALKTAELLTSRVVLLEAVAGVNESIAPRVRRRLPDGVAVEVDRVAAAWPLLVAGDDAGLEVVAERTTRHLAEGAVVLLSQASMAGAAQLIEAGMRSSVVTTPEPFVEQLLHATAISEGDR